MDEIIKSIDLARLFTSYQAETARAAAEMGCVNVLIAGNSGVGKSTIINSVFGAQTATVGVGDAQTVSIEQHQVPGKPFSIYDTRGFEIAKADVTVKTVRDKILELRRAPDANDQIHVVWLCILEQSHRVEPVHVQLLAALVELHVPTLVLITQAFIGNDEMRSDVERLAVPNSGVIPILAEDIQVDQFTVTAYGIDDLVEATMGLLQEAQREAFAAAQVARWDIKEAEALKAIKMATTAAFGTALIFVPGGPSAALLAIQVSMLAAINKKLGLPMALDKKQMIGLVGLIGTKFVGKGLFNLALSEALRFVPGAGTIAGVLIGGPVGAAFTNMLGHVYLDSVKGFAQRNEPLPSEELLAEKMAAAIEIDKDRYRSEADRALKALKAKAPNEE